MQSRLPSPGLRATNPTQVVDIINQYRPDPEPFQAIYKDLHRDPELSLQESRTAQIAADHLRSLNFTVYTAIGGHGVAGVLDNGPGPTVLLRAELDALPILEKTRLPHASQKKMVDTTDGQEKPVMHACGHDMHIAALMGACSLLKAAAPHWQGRLLAVFQPNEERGGGARAMVEDGPYSTVPRPEVVLGQHLVRDKLGTLQIGPGYALAGKRTFRVTIHGRGSHSSAPQECIDPVVVASSVVLRLQTIVSREVNPRETAVVTCGSFHAGYSPNAIPDRAQLTVDTRAFSADVLEKIGYAVGRIVRAECEASGAVEDPEIEEIENVPPLHNDLGTVGSLRQLFNALLCPGAIQPMVPDMASDDFSILAPEGVPYAYWTLGSTPVDGWDRHEREGTLNELPDTHSPLFAPAIEPTLIIGIDTLATAALTFLFTGTDI